MLPINLFPVNIKYLVTINVFLITIKLTINKNLLFLEMSMFFLMIKDNFYF
jgi:hypothetical protein